MENNSTQIENEWLTATEVDFTDEEEDNWITMVEFSDEEAGAEGNVQVDDADDVSWMEGISFTSDAETCQENAIICQNVAESCQDDAVNRQNIAREAQWLYATLSQPETEEAIRPEEITESEANVIIQSHNHVDYQTEEWLRYASQLRWEAEVEMAEEHHEMTESDEDLIDDPDYLTSPMEQNSPSMSSTSSGEESVWSVDSVPDQMRNYAYPEDYNVDLDDVPCTLAGRQLDDTVILPLKEEEAGIDVIDLVTQVPVKVIEVIDLVTQPVKVADVIEVIDLVTQPVEKPAPYANRKKKFVESSEDNDDEDEEEDIPPPPALPVPPEESLTQFFDDFNDVIRKINHQEFRERVIESWSQAEEEGEEGG